jgi:sugar lactone lactonase YvrE
LSSDTEIDGKKPKLLNDLDVSEDGIIYFTDSSTKWSRREFPYATMEGDNSGRYIQ